MLLNRSLPGSVDYQFVTLWISVPFLHSFECHCHPLYLCDGGPPDPSARWYANDGEQSLNDYFCLKAARSVRERTRERENKKESVSGTYVFWELDSGRGGGVCLVSPWDFNVLFCRSSAVITISSLSIPTAQLVGGFLPAMINYSLSESKSAFSSQIIFDEFILLTWAWIEAIEDNKLTLSILMTSRGDYGWIKE